MSPTLGNDQLHAGILAGIIGLALVALYMLVFYRLLGLVVIAGILLSGMALYTLIAWILPEVLNITVVLTLAGVTGIIVSVGVTVDSYVVYFERLKDEVRAGAHRPRRASTASFTRSFRTILAADLVSLIGAVVLYVLAIGSVRGFAFFLGLSTILDLFVAYFFMHPLVSLMARRPRSCSMQGVGIAAGLDAPTTIRRHPGARRRRWAHDRDRTRAGRARSSSGTRWADLYHERTHFEFIERSWRWAVISGTLILISVLALRGARASTSASTSRAARSGSSPWPAAGSASAGDVRDVLEPLGLGDAKVLIVGDDSVRVQSKDLSRAEQAKVTRGAGEVRAASTTRQVSVDATSVPPGATR